MHNGDGRVPNGGGQLLYIYRYVWESDFPQFDTTGTLANPQHIALTVVVSNCSGFAYLGCVVESAYLRCLGGNYCGDCTQSEYEEA